MSIIEHWTGRIPAFITRALEALAGVGLRADWSALTSDLGRAASGTLIVDDGHSTHEFPAIAQASASAADIALLPTTSRRSSSPIVCHRSVLNSSRTAAGEDTWILRATPPSAEKA